MVTLYAKKGSESNISGIPREIWELESFSDGKYLMSLLPYHEKKTLRIFTMAELAKNFYRW